MNTWNPFAPSPDPSEMTEYNPWAGANPGAPPTLPPSGFGPATEPQVPSLAEYLAQLGLPSYEPAPRPGLADILAKVFGDVQIPTGREVPSFKRHLAYAMRGLGQGAALKVGGAERERARKNQQNIDATKVYLEGKAKRILDPKLAPGVEAGASEAARIKAQRDAGPAPAPSRAVTDSEAKAFGVAPGTIMTYNEIDSRREMFSAMKPPVGMAGGAPPPLSPEALNLAARLYAITGQLPALGMGAAATRTGIIEQAAKNNPETNIAANRADFQSKQAALTQAQRSYTMTAAFENTALKNAEVLKATMAKIPDSGSPFFNTPLRQLSLKGAGSEEVAAYNTALRVVVPEFARILAGNPNLAGELSDTARKEVDQILAKNYSINQMMAALDVLATDARNRRESYKSAIDGMRSEIAAIGRPQGRTTDQRVRVVGPNGESGTMPAASALPTGWKVVP